MGELVLKKPNWKKSEYNRWADYIELLCITNEDHFISIDDFYKILFEENESGDEEHSSKYDGQMTLIKGYFDLLKYRHKTLGDFYPFKMSDNASIEFNVNIDEYNMYYLFFLISSNTCFVSSKIMYELTMSFEKVCADLLDLIQPKGAKTQIFGTSKEDNEFKGNLRSRIITLASCLNTITTKSFDNDPQYDCSGGDNGIDLISYYQLDNNEFIPFSFAQCSCSYDQWELKQESIGYEKWERRLNDITSYLKYMFVPFDCRRADGTFDNITSIYTILIDRHRLKGLLDIGFAQKKSYFQSGITLHQYLENIYFRAIKVC